MHYCTYKLPKSTQSQCDLDRLADDKGLACARASKARHGLELENALLSKVSTSSHQTLGAMAAVITLPRAATITSPTICPISMDYWMSLSFQRFS